ncbi:glutaredoxin family protein [Catenuloplanes sp. NPDC051500]|uniref:glutaredoxin family protein n=1 Tax=Catenuloplanes sp. NPDC051500 TaxID=3363959 RepID=UPI0037A2E693
MKADSEPRLTLITRTGCHLCDTARESIDRVVAATGDRYLVIDVESDPELEREYGERVPVILLDGREHGYWRVEEQRLLADLAQPR